MIVFLLVAPIEQSHRRALTTANTTQSISVFLSSGLIEWNNQIVDSVELDELYLLTHPHPGSTHERIHLRNTSAGMLIMISIFHLLGWMESSKSIVVFVERVKIYLAPSTTTMGSTLGRIASWNTEEILFFRQKSTVFRIFFLFSSQAPRQAIVDLVELVELYVVPSTRAAGSVCGRILSRKNPNLGFGISYLPYQC